MMNKKEHECVQPLCTNLPPDSMSLQAKWKARKDCVGPALDASKEVSVKVNTAKIKYA
jgi:hypothetical protein